MTWSTREGIRARHTVALFDNKDRFHKPLALCQQFNQLFIDGVDLFTQFGNAFVSHGSIDKPNVEKVNVSKRHVIGG